MGLGRYAHQRGFLLHRDAGGQEAMERALQLTGLTELRSKSALALSGGELQRVFLAQAFAPAAGGGVRNGRVRLDAGTGAAVAGRKQRVKKRKEYPQSCACRRCGYFH